MLLDGAIVDRVTDREAGACHRVDGMFPVHSGGIVSNAIRISKPTLL
jgi:hypothetical protein